MTTKLLVYLSAPQITVAIWRSGQIKTCHDLPNDRDGLTAFSRMLDAHTGLPLYLMVDAVEEDFRSETLPHTLGSSRKEMLARKLKQVYRNTNYYAAWLQGRQADKRRDDRFLFVAMTNPDLLRPWLEIIHSKDAPLAGIYLLPTVSQALVSRLKVTAPNLLLVTEQSGGLRQSFLQKNRLRVSRLTPLDASSNEPSNARYRNELEKTRLYLNSLRLTNREEQMTVCILDVSGQLDGLAKELNQDPSLQCLRLTSAEIASRLDISPEILASCGNAAHLAVLGKSAPNASIAPPGLTQGYRIYQLRHALYGLSAVVLVTALTWSGINLSRQIAAESEIASLRQATQQEEAAYLKAASQFPESPTSAENMAVAVATADRIVAQSRTPNRLMQVISSALDMHPLVQLDQLEWERNGDKEQGSGIGNAALDQEIGYIEGEIRPFQGDYRAAIAEINAFAQDLRGNEDIADIAVLKLPLNINPDVGLTGSTAERASQPTQAQFQIRITLRQAK